MKLIGGSFIDENNLYKQIHIDKSIRLEPGHQVVFVDPYINSDLDIVLPPVSDSAFDIIQVIMLGHTAALGGTITIQDRGDSDFTDIDLVADDEFAVLMSTGIEWKTLESNVT